MLKPIGGKQGSAEPVQVEEIRTVEADTTSDVAAGATTNGATLKVLHVYRTYFPDTQGGLEEVIRQICLNSQADGVVSRVFTLSDTPQDGALQLPEATVYQVQKTFEVASCSVSMEAFGAFTEHVAWADVVHYHFPWPFVDVLHFAARVDKPTLLTYHSDIVRQRVLGQIYAPLMHRFLSSVDRIVCTSANYFATSDVLARYSSKVEVVPIGINQSSYVAPADDDLQAVQQQYGSNFFLFVGVLRYYKGLHILLDAIQDAPFRVVIAGSGPTEQELRQQAATLGIRNLEFAGYVPDGYKNALFKLCRGVVFPSYLRSEAFGVTLLEGAMFGKPLISTEVGSGTSHVNVHDQTGYVVPPGSAKALRRAMDKLWHDEALARRLGDGARTRYESLFTGRLMGERYAGIYRRLSAERGVAEISGIDP